MRHQHEQRGWLTGLLLGLSLVGLLGTTVTLPTGGGGTGITVVEDDPAPVLGGNLDADGHDITNLDDVTGDDATFDAIVATTVAASGQVSGSVCAAAGGAEEDNSLELTLIDPGPPNASSAGTRRLVDLLDWWHDVDRTAAPNTLMSPVIVGESSIDGTSGLGTTANVIVLTADSSGIGKRVKESTITVDANGNIPEAKVDVDAENDGLAGKVYCALGVDTTKDSGTELCTSIDADYACVGASISYSTAAGVAVVTTAACATDNAATGTFYCAPCQ